MRSKTNFPIKIGNIHFIGIGGIGMSGIAEVLMSHGYDVQGSDLNNTKITRRLQKLGETKIWLICQKNHSPSPMSSKRRQRLTLLW